MNWPRRDDSYRTQPRRPGKLPRLGGFSLSVGSNGDTLMAGRIGSVQQATHGQSYGFVIYDEADRVCLCLGFSTWHEADAASREARSLLVSAFRCVRR